MILGACVDDLMALLVSRGCEPFPTVLAGERPLPGVNAPVHLQIPSRPIGFPAFLTFEWVFCVFFRRVVLQKVVFERPHMAESGQTPVTGVRFLACVPPVVLFESEGGAEGVSAGWTLESLGAGTQFLFYHVFLLILD